VASLSSNAQTTTNKQSGNETIITVTVVLIVFVLLILAGVFIIKNKGCDKKTAYDKWTEYYSTPSRPSPQENVDIHHFYNKSNLPAPPFTPHIAVENKKRYSASPQRLSISPARRISMVDKL